MSIIGDPLLLGGGAPVIEQLNVNGSGTFTPGSGVDGFNPVVVPAGTEGTPTATKGTVSNNSVQVTPKVTNTGGFITGGVEKTGTPVTVQASELVSGTKSITSSGETDVTNYQKASVAAGTAGTPTASKGAVSNNSVAVTPSVTNVAGLIAGGTKTGTPVTVSASELVSGSETKTQNGTYNVVNLAELVVNVSGSGGLAYETGTYTPSSDTAQPTISFAKSHTAPPAFVAMSDTSSASGITGNSNTSWSIVDHYQLLGSGWPYSTTSSRYGLAIYSYRSSSSATATCAQIQYNSSDTGSSTSSYYRYWATESAFKPGSNSTSRYWRSGRTYKWIAIWV